MAGGASLPRPWDEPDHERWVTAEWSVGMIQFSAKTARMAFAALLLFGNAVWVSDSAASPASLAALVKKADDAYRNLPGSIATYDLAMQELCLEMEVESPRQFASNLRRLGVEFDSPKVALPLRRIQVAAFLPGSDRKQIGVPLSPAAW